MLPVVICEPDQNIRERWMEILGGLVREEYPSLRTEILTGTERELEQMLREESGIMLAILCVTAAARDGVEGCIRCFQAVMARNRDSYAVLCLHDGRALETVLSRCMRPAGILMLPLREELAKASLRRVLNDYISLNLDGNEADHIVVNAGRTVQRIAYRDILYLEAQNKLLNICLSHQVVTVRASLNQLEQALPDGFVRCHRSFIVNWSYVESFSASEMTLTLTTRERLPVSRSCRDAVRGRWGGGAEDAL